MTNQLNESVLLSFDEMLQHKGHSWARRTMPYQGSALIIDVVRKDSSSFNVVFDEGAVKGFSVDGQQFQRSYIPVAVARTPVPITIQHALAAYERAVQTCSRGIAGTAQYNHLLSEQHRCRELLLRAIVSVRGI